MKRRPMLPVPRPALRPSAPETISWDFVDTRPPSAGTNHFHWGITAFMGKNDEGMMLDSVTVEVEAPSEEEAINRAMDIIERRHYRVSWVREACSTDKEVKGG